MDPNRTPGTYNIVLDDISSGLSANVNLAVTSSSISPSPPPSPITVLPPELAFFQPIVTGIETFFIDIFNFASGIVQPITSFISGAISNAVQMLLQSATSGISFIENILVTQIGNVVSDISNAINSTVTDIGNVIIEIISANVTPTLTQILDGMNSIGTTFSNIEQQIISSIENSVVSILNQVMTNIISVQDTISNSISAIATGLSSSIGNITNQIESVYNSLTSEITSFEVNFSNQFQGLYAAFNSFETILSNSINVIGNDISSLGTAIMTGIETVIIPGVTAITNDIGNTFNGLLDGISKPLILLATQKTSDEPTTALQNLLVEIADIGAVITAGYVALTALENVNPLSNLRLSDTFKSILEFVGVYDISRETLKLFVDNGIGLQAEYAINSVFQARRISPQESQKAVWYGTNNITDYQNDLQFEGFTPDARNKMASTVYRPMPVFILEKLIELQLIDNNFSQQQLLEEGFDPKNIAALQSAFANLELSGFQSTVKTLIYSMYKDGFVNNTIAIDIMTVFAIPKTQQEWILKTADQEYQYETQLLFSTQIIDAYKKGVINTDDSLADLTALGMTRIRAKQKLAIAAITNLPALSKSERQSFYSDLATLGVLTS